MLTACPGLYGTAPVVWIETTFPISLAPAGAPAMLTVIVRPTTAGRVATAIRFDDIKQGDCNSFATALAVLCRAIGIPARVASGFLPGMMWIFYQHTADEFWYNAAAKYTKPLEHRRGQAKQHHVTEQYQQPTLGQSAEESRRASR